MADERLGYGALYSVDYMRAISEALVCWVGLEWMAVNCAKHYDADFVNRIRKLPVKNPGPSDKQTWTGGVIAREFLNLAQKDVLCPDGRLAKAAQVFKDLVPSRNDLFHASPAASEEDPRIGTLYDLKRSRRITIKDIQDFGDQAAICSSELNFLFYNYLRPDLLAKS